MVAKGGKVQVFRKEPTPAEVAAATSDPYESYGSCEDWDPAPLAEPAAAEPTENVLESLRPAIMRDVPCDRVPVPDGQNDREGQPAPTGVLTGLPDARERHR